MRGIPLVLTLLAPPAGDVVAADPEPLAPGARSKVSLTVRGTAARELPLLVHLWADDGVRLLENRLDWRDVVDPAAEQPRLEAPIQAPAGAGTYQIRGSVIYWVCDARRCRQRSGRVSWTLTVRSS